MSDVREEEEGSNDVAWVKDFGDTAFRHGLRQQQLGQKHLLLVQIRVWKSDFNTL